MGIKWPLQTQWRERGIHVIRKYFVGGCNIRYMFTDHSLKEKLHKHHFGLSTLRWIGTSSPSHLPWVPEVFTHAMCDKELPQLQANTSSAKDTSGKDSTKASGTKGTSQLRLKTNTHSIIYIYNQLKLTANPYLLCWLLHCGAKLLFKRVTMNFSQGIKQHQSSNQNSQEDSPLQSDW